MGFCMQASIIIIKLIRRVLTLKQLETKFYSRQEIAEILSVNIKDSNNFKRNVENKLRKWGYKYNYSRKGVEIIEAPISATAKLSEILIRHYGIDIQIDAYSFACFISAFVEIEGFCSMPWEERKINMEQVYGISVEERTLRNWCNKLINTNTIAKTGEKTNWRTICISGKKEREWIDGIPEAEQEMKEYYSLRKQLVDKYIADAVAAGKTDCKEIKAEAWKTAYETLWKKYGCCYYSCKGLLLSGFDDTEVLAEIYELVNKITTEGE